MPPVPVRVPGRRAILRHPSRDGVVTSWPVTTAFLLVALVVVFQIERRIASPGEERALSTTTEILLGGLSGTLVEAGQWSRLLSSAFLHASTEHLVGNAIALGLAGYGLERIVGHAWTFNIFILGAVCGGLASVLTLPASTVSVGASGGVLAVLGALFMTSFRLPAGRASMFTQAQTVFFGLPLLVPHDGVGPLHVNYSAHVGGAILGILIGTLLLAGWEDRSTRPPCAVEASLLSVVAVLGIACSAYAAQAGYRLYGPASRFIPVALMPGRPADSYAHGNELAARFPMDARSHLFAATADLRRKDTQAAEAEFNQALDLSQAAPGLYQLDAMNTVHLLLALLIFADGRPRDAIGMAQPFCRQPHRIYPTPALAALASKDRLCP